MPPTTPQPAPLGILRLGLGFSWAVSESAALIGGVVYLLTDERQWFLIGLAAMLIGFALVPIRPET